MSFLRTVALAAALSWPLAACSQAGSGTGAAAAKGPETGYLSAVSFDTDAGVALGSPDAPLTLIEYASLTCGHCKDFHEAVLPRIKADYVATGKVRYIFREFPTAPAELALAGFATARCVGEDGYFAVLDDFFASQSAIFESARAGTVARTLTDLAGRHGLGEAEFEACLNDSSIRRAIAASVNAGQSEGVDSTPTLILDGEVLLTPDSRTPDGLAAIIDAALAGEGGATEYTQEQVEAATAVLEDARLNDPKRVAEDRESDED